MEDSGQWKIVGLAIGKGDRAKEGERRPPETREVKALWKRNRGHRGPNGVASIRHSRASTNRADFCLKRALSYRRVGKTPEGGSNHIVLFSGVSW